MIGEGRAAAPEPGDIYIVNDPYLGGTHLMDVRFARPYYRDGKLWCWLSNTGHWPDTGGAVPGGFSASATAVEQEGLRLPPVKLFKKGVLDEEIYAIICSNIRVADQRIGDVKAQAAALDVGADRLDLLLGRYGDETVAEAITELRRRAATQMRRMIATMPEGSWRSVAYVDSDGVVDEPLEISLMVSKVGRQAGVRFRRVQPALPRADEFGAGDDAEFGLSGDAAYLPRSADQRRGLRTAGNPAAGRHLSRRALSAPGIGLRRRGQPADRRSGVRRHGAAAFPTG